MFALIMRSFTFEPVDGYVHKPLSPLLAPARANAPPLASTLYPPLDMRPRPFSSSLLDVVGGSSYVLETEVTGIVQKPKGNMPLKPILRL